MLATYVHLVPRLSRAILLHPVYAFVACNGKGHLITDHEGPEGEQRYSSTLSLISGLDRDGWLAPRPGYFTTPFGKRAGTHFTGGCVGPRVGLDGCGKISLPPGFDPHTVKPVESRYTD